MAILPLSRRALVGLGASAGLLLAASVTPAFSAPPEALRIAVEGEYPPFNQTDKKGKLSGFDIDIANALCKALQANSALCLGRWQPWLFAAACAAHHPAANPPCLPRHPAVPR